MNYQCRPSKQIPRKAQNQKQIMKKLKKYKRMKKNPKGKFL